MVIWLQNVMLSDVCHLYPPQIRTRAYLYECLSSWMRHVAEDKLQVYVDSLAAQQFEPETRAQRLPLCLSILHGLSKAMAVPNPPQNCWTALCSATEKIYNLLPDNIPVCPGSETPSRRSAFWPTPSRCDVTAQSAFVTAGSFTSAWCVTILTEDILLSNMLIKH